MTSTDTDHDTCPDGHPVTAEQAFCGQCGRRVQVEPPGTCAAGHTNPAGFAYCGTCGLRLDPDTAEPLEADDLAEVVSVELVGQELVEADEDEDRPFTRVAATLRYTNHTAHDVAAFTGTVLFLDVFDRVQFGTSLTIDLLPLPAQSSVLDDSLGHDLIPGRADHAWLAAHVDGPFSFVWVPEAVLLADGTMLGRPGLGGE